MDRLMGLVRPKGYDDYYDPSDFSLVSEGG